MNIFTNCEKRSFGTHSMIPSIHKMKRFLHILQYGRFLSTQVLKSSANNVQLWARIQLDKESVQSFMMAHRLCDGASNLGCILEFESSAIGVVASSGRGTDGDRNKGAKESLGSMVALLHQLIGCNLRAVAFQTSSSFLLNKRGFPTLSKANQFLFAELLKRLGRTCRVLVEGMPHSKVVEACEDETALGRSGVLPYLQYLRHLRSKEEVRNVIDTQEANMEKGYLDHLQSALQPLGDNLEFSTYEVFEKDPVKYERYREAVELALKDKIKLGQLLTEPVCTGSNDTIIHVKIFVVGAGRGPLVNASLKAVSNMNETNSKILGNASKVTVQPHIIAVEKNPSALVYLNSLKQHSPAWSVVDVVECDMRFAHRNPLLASIMNGDDLGKADIVVSELLGSFGDNELSPECLDGVQRSGLMKESCISIPQSYTSFIAPVTSMKLHAEAQAHAYVPSNSLEGPSGKPCGTLHAMETPYVVRPHAASQIHKELPCWKFSHPLQKENVNIQEAAESVNNERCACVEFCVDKDNGVAYSSGYGNRNKTISKVTTTEQDMDCYPSSNTIHGFLGSFHCVLYESVGGNSIISIAPTTFSTGMFSWFPLYFPLREPVLVPPASIVRCSIWRKCDPGRVWYEWCAEITCGDHTTCVSNVHNPNGRSSFVRL